MRRFIPVLCILLALPAPGLAGGFSSAAEISAACAAPVLDAANDKELKRLQAGATASMPNVSCIAVMFGDSRDHILTFKPAADRSWFLTRILHFGSREPSFEFSHTPVDAVRKLVKGWDAQHWAFAAPEFRIAQELPLVLRRPGSRRKAAPVRTLRVVRSFPIERDGQVADRLHILVDDWGRWRGRKKPPERKWQIYSERANAVVLRSILYTNEPDQVKWDSANLTALAYLKESQFDLVISRGDLAPLREFMKGFDVWAAE